MLESGFALGHQGPTATAPVGQAPLLSFVDEKPGKYVPRTRVEVWGVRGEHTFSHREEPSANWPDR